MGHKPIRGAELRVLIRVRFVDVHSNVYMYQVIIPRSMCQLFVQKPLSSGTLQNNNDQSPIDVAMKHGWVYITDGH